jgi:THO complex subunit 5
MSPDIDMATNGVVSEPSLAQVLSTSKEAYDHAMDLLAKLEEAIRTHDGTLSTEQQGDLLHRQKLMYSNIAFLRGLHRTAHLNARETKTVTADARLEVDRLHLQLQNLYYEQRHLDGEISACESYE